MSESNTCKRERIAAFIDGELDAAACSALEAHLFECAACASELRQQQLFMCELDAALTNTAELEVPANFARTIAVRAESDMSGVRDRSEHKRALLYSMALGFAAFVFLGVGASGAMLLRVQAIFQKTLGVLELIGKTAYDAAAGFTVIMRVLGGGLHADSRLITLVFFIFVLGLLSLLIARYHRMRITE